MTGDYEDLGLTPEEELDLEADWNLPLAFTKQRHTEKIEGTTTLTQTWRMKERMKTVSVALVICLNVGVDPPDIVKTQPCARLECWIDPLSTSPQKALEGIGANLQKQYERWQPRARYKQSLDPTVDEVKKLCTSLRRNAKEERVLFHYNGHGVPKPTVNGEIWVFNKSYTQYIPLSVYDLHSWMGTPSIYVYDCSNAGIILKSFRDFSTQGDKPTEEAALNASQTSTSSLASTSTTAVKSCIQLASCGPNELLPMSPDLPADLFTSCLTTPIKIALRWYVLQNSGKLISGLTQERVDRIPGQLNDRRTMLGELNWIFTAITDTIAWNVLPRDLFQKLFRQDLLVASLFRNFLLAERIMRTYNCTPVSCPALPPTYQHHMWQAWDLALDLCLGQLGDILDNGASFKHSPFFAEQLTAFQVWLNYGSIDRNPPEQLPIVLQVLLSQVHRLRALDLLGLFLDLGPWAVSLALSVGIFPYVLKLLQSSARELRPLLVFIWAKILAVDNSCQADLVKDNGHKYFLSVLADPYMPAEHRTMAAFVLAMIVNNYPNGQEAAMKGNLITICLEQLLDPAHLLRQWLALCLAKVWTNFSAARWCGVRDIAHEKLYCLLDDPEPQVRAATVFALGTFISNSTERSDHANNIDHTVGMKLVNMVNDGSPLVRKELAVALGGLVQQFETQFAAVAYQFMEEERLKQTTPLLVTGVTTGGWNLVNVASDGGSSSSGSGSSGSAGTKASTKPGGLKTVALSPLQSYNSSGGSSYESLSGSVDITVIPNLPSERIKRVSSSTSLTGILNKSLGNVFTNGWSTLLHLATDPFPDIQNMAKSIVNVVNLKAKMSAQPRQMKQSTTISHSAPASPSNKPIIPIMSETPPPSTHDSSALINPSTSEIPIGSKYRYSTQFSRSRKMFDKGPSVVTADDKEEEPVVPLVKNQPMATEFFSWCCIHFAQSVKRLPEDHDLDLESSTHHEREFKFIRNANLRREARSEQLRAGLGRLDEEIFVNKNTSLPTVIRFQPYEPNIAVADKEGVSVWNWEQGVHIHHFANHNPRNSRITSMDFINAHDKTLLLTGSDDGAVRVWNDFCGLTEAGTQLLTAWQALSDMLPSNRGSGIVTEFEQESSHLLVSGDVRLIRLWDVNREMKLRDIPTGADSCVTSLSTHQSTDRSLLIAGCGDGSVRVYDRRIPSPDCRIMTLREHKGWVVKVHMQGCTNGKIVSASAAGDVRFWDPRSTESIHTVNTANGLTALEVHPYADVIACGSVNQMIRVFNTSGDSLSVIKYHEGFMGQRIGAVTCLAFHPYKVKLAAGSTDSFITVHSTPENKKR